MIAKIAFATITLLALLNLANLADAQSATLAHRKEKRFLDCTLEAKTIDDCDTNSYTVRVLVFSLPGLIIALFFLWICPWYCCCKYCCDCCGGRSQSPNCCCANPQFPARYSAGDIVRPKVVLILVLLATIAALIWSLIGVDLILTGFLNFVKAFLGIPDVLTHEINLIGDSLVINRYDTTTNQTVTEKLFETSGVNVKQEAETARDNMRDKIAGLLNGVDAFYDNLAYSLYSLFIAPAVLIFLGFLLGVLNCRKFASMAIVWFLFLFGFLMWLGHFGLSLSSMVVGDICAEVSGLANKQVNLVTVLANCDDSMFSAFKNAFRQLEITQAEDTCNTISGLPNPGGALYGLQVQSLL